MVSNKAILYEQLESDAIRCTLCSHYCLISLGQKGTCRLRTNIGGELFTSSWGKSSGFAIDPIEKKPFFHYKPSSRVLSFGTPGCNFSCLNCQNSSLSQAVRQNKPILDNSTIFLPEDIALMAEQNNVDGIAYTYSEPTIFFEYARDTILECRKHSHLKDLFHVFVSNGYFSKEMLDIVSKENLLQAVNIDLKFISDEKYKKICGARLQPILDNIKRIYDLRKQIHLEIINLIIPGENDSDEEINKLCEFVAGISTDIPLHFSRFFPRYKMMNTPATPIETMLKAQETAKSYKMKYIYLGNMDIPNALNTYCPNCSKQLIERDFYEIKKNILLGSDKCPDCNYQINIR